MPCTTGSWRRSIERASTDAMDRFERSGLRFQVLDSGPADGVTVVLLHGFPQRPSCYDGVARRLNDAGLRTLVPTQRGYTASARPQRRRDYRTRELTDDVLALLDAAGVQRAHIVGHDWGGALAWAMARWHPDRTASVTVLSTPHPATMMDAFRGSNQALRSWYMAFFQLPLLPEILARRILAKTLRNTGLPAEYVETYVSAMAEPGALTGAINWYRGIPFSIRDPVGRIKVPTTYIWGRHDVALNRFAAERTGAYVDGPYEFVDLDANHWLPETEPDTVADAIMNRVHGSAG
jgi:pimeloyl-ACP methyl ester carboxylesterase